MKGFKKIAGLLMMLLIAGLVGIMGVQKAACADIDFSSEPVKAFIEFKTAIEKGRYPAAWNMVSGFLRQKAFSGKFENFKELYQKPVVQQNFLSFAIKEVNELSEDCVELLVSPPIRKFYMVKENEVWKFNGKFNPQEE